MEALRRRVAVTTGLAARLDPLEGAGDTLRGVRDNALDRFTHTDLMPLLEQRFRQVSSSMERAGDPTGPE